MLLRAGARGGRSAKDEDQNEFDGVPMLEPEWIRCRSATAYRMSRELDQIRVEMVAMFETALLHQVRTRPSLSSAAKHMLKCPTYICYLP